MFKRLQKSRNSTRQNYDILVSVTNKTYSGIWKWRNSNATKAMDKNILWYARTILKVKSNTCNVITLGECGVIPPSIICHKQVMCYYKRLYNMSSNAMVKKVFDELKKIDDMGFKTWITSVRELASRYDISLNSELEFDAFKTVCTGAVEQKFIAEWQNDVKMKANIRFWGLIENLKPDMNWNHTFIWWKILNIELQFPNFDLVHTCWRLKGGDIRDL